jgi:hypothetical protein
MGTEAKLCDRILVIEFTVMTQSEVAIGWDDAERDNPQIE